MRGQVIQKISNLDPPSFVRATFIPSSICTIAVVARPFLFSMDLSNNSSWSGPNVSTSIKDQMISLCISKISELYTDLLEFPWKEVLKTLILAASDTDFIA